MHYEVIKEQPIYSMHTIVGSVLKTGSTCNHALPLQNTFQSALVASINSVAVRYHSFCISIM